MTLTDITASLTGEHSLAKYTGERDHPSPDEITDFCRRRSWTRFVVTSRVVCLSWGRARSCSW
jgi:hypothetical protein